MNQKFWMVLGTLAAIIVGIWFVNTYVIRPSAITVVGEGKLSTKPEEVSLIVTRVDASSDIVGAIDQGEQSLNKLTATARTLATDAQIQKSFYRVSPSANGQYIVANAFSLKTKNVSQLGSLIKSLYQNGATTISNVSFTSADKDETDQEARLLAVKDAKEKARMIAKSAGKRLGRLISITDDNVAPASSVSTGTNIDIVKQVSVIYEIW